MATKTKTEKIDTKQVEARKEAAKAQAGQPGDVTTDQGPGKRAFQTGPEPGQREWLDEKEATARGFYWKPDPPEAKKKG